MDIKKISVSEIKTGIIFNQPVFIEGNSILLRAFEPLRSSELERLKKYHIGYVYTYGEEIVYTQAEEELKDLASGIINEKGPDITDIYSISTAQEIEVAKKHQEVIDIVKNTFDLARKGKIIDIQQIRNAVSLLLNIAEKNRRVIFKLVFISSLYPNEFLYYHATNSALLAAITGISLKFNKLQLNNLLVGTLLQNIGMVKIPEEIIMKKTALTVKEIEFLKNHPLLGYKIVQGTNSFSTDVMTIVLQHHERLDGTGYPSRLMNKQISDYPKITAICDTYQAMCSKREYRGPITPPVIIKSLLKEGLGKLDPNILKAFIYSVGIYPIGLMLKLTNGEIGEVILQNINALPRPVVKVFIDPSNNAIEPGKIMNLAIEKTVDVEKVLNNEENKEIIRLIGRS